MQQVEMGRAIGPCHRRCWPASLRRSGVCRRNCAHELSGLRTIESEQSLPTFGRSRLDSRTEYSRSSAQWGVVRRARPLPATQQGYRIPARWSSRSRRGGRRAPTIMRRPCPVPGGASRRDGGRSSSLPRTRSVVRIGAIRRRGEVASLPVLRARGCLLSTSGPGAERRAAGRRSGERGGGGRRTAQGSARV